MGSAPDLLREHMEIRGLGILNIRELFGVSAISGPKQLGLNIRLERWVDATEVDRLGLEERTVNILGVAVPYFVLPVSPGRNLATLVETASKACQSLRSSSSSGPRPFARAAASLARTTAFSLASSAARAWMPQD